MPGDFFLFCDHAQNSDLRAGVPGGDLISCHGFGEGVPQGRCAGGPGRVVSSDLIADCSLNVFSRGSGKDPDDVTRMASGKLIFSHGFAPGTAQNGTVSRPRA